MAANQNIARLGVVLGLETGEYTTEINQIIQANKKMEREVNSSVKAITKEIEELEFATKNYGKTLTKAEQVEQQIARLRYSEANVGSGLIKKLRETAAAYDAQAAAANRAAAADKKAMGGFSNQQMAALGYQTTDIITGLAGGQNPILVLIQQGGQLRDQFGGVANVFKAFASVLTIGRIAAAGLVGVLGGLAYAFYEGSKQAKEFNNALALTNNYAGISLSGFNKLAEQLGGNTKNSISDAKDVIQELVSSGKFTEKTLSVVSEAILRYAKLSGKDAKEAAKELMSAFDGTSSSVKTLDDRLHFLSPEQAKHIAMLSQQGDKQRVIVEGAGALSSALKKQGEDVGDLAATWQLVVRGISDYIDGITRLGQIGTKDDVLERLKNRLKDLQQSQAPAGSSARENIDKEVEYIKGRIADLEKYKADKAKQTEKAVAEAKEKADFERAGGQNRTLDLEFEAKKQAIQEEANLRMVTATEFERIEIDGWKRIQESKLALERRFREVGYGLADQERKAQAAEEVRILADVEQKKAHLAKQAYDEFNKAQQLRANEVEMEREKLQIYERNIFASEEEAKIAERRLKTEQEIAKIMKLEKLTPEQQEAAIQREKQIGRESEALIKQAENLKMLKGVNDAVFSSMADTIEQFMKTGKLSFKSFFSSIVAQMIHLQAQMMAMRAMSGLGSLFNLGGGAGPVELSGATEYIGPAFADGGSPPVGVPSLVGEKGPELFIPRTAGTIVPNDKLSSLGMGQQPQVVYNGPYIASMNAIDTQSATQFLAKNKMAVWSANQSASRSIPVSR